MSEKSGNGKRKKKDAKPVKNSKKAGSTKFKKGQSGNPAGRPRGSKNKFTQVLVDLVFDIEKELTEKKKGLKDCAEQDPKWFYEKFLSKLLPKPVDVSADVSGEFTFKWEK